MTKVDLSARAVSLTLGVALALTGCGGSGSGSDATGRLSLAITDAAVDNVEEVWVQFTGVRLKPAAGPEIGFTFDAPLDVDLMTLTGENTATLLNNVEVPAGPYNWIALDVNAEVDDAFDSYVVDDMGGMVELRVPSGSQQGLRLVSGFTVLAGGEVSFVIDWDLRKGLTDPIGQEGYHLRPALRITDLAEYGTISGTVADALTMDPGCASDADGGNLVYVYEGADVVPMDIDGVDPDPLTTAKVAVDPDAAGAYTYSATYLPPGAYTVAFTCQGLNEDPENDDGLTFVGARNAAVVADQVATVDFQGP